MSQTSLTELLRLTTAPVSGLVRPPRRASCLASRAGA